VRREILGLTVRAKARWVGTTRYWEGYAEVQIPGSFEEERVFIFFPVTGTDLQDDEVYLVWGRGGLAEPVRPRGQEEVGSDPGVYGVQGEAPQGDGGTPAGSMEGRPGTEVK